MCVNFMCTIDPCVRLEVAAVELCKVQRRLGVKVEANFNGVPLIADTASTPESIMARYEEHKAFRVDQEILRKKMSRALTFERVLKCLRDYPWAFEAKDTRVLYIREGAPIGGSAEDWQEFARKGVTALDAYGRTDTELDPGEWLLLLHLVTSDSRELVSSLWAEFEASWERHYSGD